MWCFGNAGFHERVRADSNKIVVKVNGRKIRVVVKCIIPNLGNRFRDCYLLDQFAVTQNTGGNLFCSLGKCHMPEIITGDKYAPLIIIHIFRVILFRSIRQRFGKSDAFKTVTVT